MPNTTPRVAFVEIEAMRKAIEAAEFTVDTSAVPIKATMSFGIASRDGRSEPLADSCTVPIWRCTTLSAMDEISLLFTVMVFRKWSQPQIQ